MKRTLPQVEIVDFIYSLTNEVLTLIEKLKQKDEIINCQEDSIGFWKAAAYEHGYDDEGDEQ